MKTGRNLQINSNASYPFVVFLNQNIIFIVNKNENAIKRKKKKRGGGY